MTADNCRVLKGLSVVLLIAAAMALLLLTQACASVPEQYVRAHRKTHHRLAPHIEARIATLDAERAESLRDLFDSEGIMIEEAERSLGIKWDQAAGKYLDK